MAWHGDGDGDGVAKSKLNTQHSKPTSQAAGALPNSARSLVPASIDGQDGLALPEPDARFDASIPLHTDPPSPPAAPDMRVKPAGPVVVGRVDPLIICPPAGLDENRQSESPRSGWEMGVRWVLDGSDSKRPAPSEARPLRQETGNNCARGTVELVPVLARTRCTVPAFDVHGRYQRDGPQSRPIARGMITPAAA